jgi:hypothetical protein
MSLEEDILRILKKHDIASFRVTEDIIHRVLTIEMNPPPTEKLVIDLTRFLPPEWKLTFEKFPYDKDHNNYEGVAKKDLEKMFPSKDLVNHPPHYNFGKIEVIEFIEDQKLGYHIGNTVKYLSRAGRKDPAKLIEDLDKAAWYLLRYIENLKAEKEGRAACRPNETGKK